MKSSVKVFLNKDIANLGKSGTILSVSHGYAYNYLIPQGLAQIATTQVTNQVNNKRILEEQRILHKKEKLNEIKNELEKYEIFSIKKKIGKNNIIFGSISEKEVSSTIQNQTNIKVNKNNIILENKIRKLGTYPANIKLGFGIYAKVKLNVISI
uniref:50S ribosomal protein L9, chloroplastic n=1 Tax=Sciadococcus taiwanensis TaxID=3028030 RepID=A0A9Y1MWI8_9RHOD|nr:ribosomal protein L9 [Sciadococcus taiwanensis]